jgi:outer membrane protein OmpA-like peptidoglycan-associated protein
VLIAIPLLTLLGSSAMAEGYSTDIELVHPTFGYGSFFGVDTPWISPAGSVLVGFSLQYEDDPLVVIQGAEESAVVGQRTVLHIGSYFSVTDKIAISFGLPVSATWGSEAEPFTSDGGALGDARVGGHFQLAEYGGLTIGARTGFTVPTSSPDSYFGEVRPRGEAGILGAYSKGSLDLLSEIGFTGRSRVDTAEDFTLGSELYVRTGARAFVLDDKVALQLAVHNRAGLSNLYSGGAENTAGFLAGVHLRPSSLIALDIGGGKGITEGYGATDFRLMASMTITAREIIYEDVPDPLNRELQITDISFSVPDAVLIDAFAPEPVVVQWEDDELARVKQDRIIIRESIQFQVGTESILPSSQPTLWAIAELMNTDARIGHLLIEGHASEEGDFSTNFDLSNRRARAVFRAVVQAGVHPYRLSYRGMGEVVPAVDQTNISGLAVNRRVEFKIISQYDTGDQVPDYPEKILLPWSGEKGDVVNPPPPTNRTVRKKKKSASEEETFNPEDFELKDDDVSIEGTGGAE